MAKFFPLTPHSGTPTSERRVWQAFQLLEDDWLVFHSVAWQSVRAGRQGDGEADFVLVHPRRGVVVIEVKGGEISIEQGIWYSRSHFGDVNRIKNPFDQAKDSKFALLRHLKEICGPDFGATVWAESRGVV